jgi:hypothetical protein
MLIISSRYRDILSARNLFHAGTGCVLRLEDDPRGQGKEKKAIDKQGLCRLGSCDCDMFPTRDLWRETLIP